MKNMSKATNPASDSTPMESSESKGETHSTELVGRLPNDIFVYRQDVVSCRKYEGLLGVVLEVAGDAESEGSITDDSDNNEEDDRGTTNGNAGGDVEGDDANENDNGDGGDTYDSLPDGQVRVVWTDGSETEEHISDITVVDRSFLHGDFIASASDPTGQMGLVVDVEITVDLQAASGELIKKVSSKDLKRIRDPLVGDYVVNGPWLGRVDDVLDSVTVLFDDGAVCKVVKADPMRLKPNSKLTDESCPYYPGQRVKAVSSSVFKSSRWLSGLWKANRLEGTVIKVQAASVIVYWIASAYLGIETNSEAVPSEEQDPKNLTVLSCFSYANWQLEDWCHLVPSFLVDDASKSSKEHVGGSTSAIVEDCENTNPHINSSTEGSDQVFDVPVSVLGDQGSETTNPEEEAQYETSKFSDTTMSGDLAFNPESHDSVTIDETVKSGGNDETEPNDVLLESGSGNSPSSVSKEPAHDTWPAYRKKLRKFFFKRDRKAHKREDTFERALFIVNTATKVDVAWQDGTKEYGLDSKSLIPIHTPSDHEFFPEQYVVEKVSDEDESSEKKRVGVVRNVNSKERTVYVRWFKAASRPEDPREFDCDEVVSAYELEEHPDYDYCYGDVVVRLSPVSGSAEQPEQNTDLMEAESNKSRKLSDNDGVDELAKNDASATFLNLSWVGNISGLVDGDIEVTWADGMVSKVGPQAVFVVGREDGDSFDGGSEISDDGASWETVEEDESGAPESTEKEHELQNPAGSIVEREKDPAISVEDNNAVTNGPLSMPLAAIGFVTRFATGLFSRGRKQYDLSDAGDMAINETEPMDNVEISGELDNMEHNYQESDALNDVSMKDAPETAEKRNVASTEDGEPIYGDHLDDSVPVETNTGVTEMDSKDDPSSFKHFDISENPLDHFYLSSGQNSVERKWVKKVHHEWNILEKNLPDDIYVRVFEDRMDLVRAVIIGACGTPYQDGLFFFDFLLAPDYPQVPPSAYYHSGGLRVNPNLYVDGKVCLSLLNTWTGKGNEVWDPSSSSILQVLVSLQGLVLNSKPYFNEAGYEKQVGTVEGEKNSLPYNENTYLLNLKSMLYLLRRPPMHFEGFVRDHFRRRGHYILKACEAYMEGRTIGSLTKDACTTEKSEEHPCSTGFKLMLAKILPRLISALTEVGVDCKQFENLHQSENHTRN